MISMKNVQNLNALMELYIQANGKTISAMALEASYGRMEPNMREIGKTIRPMDRALSGIPQVMSTKVIGSKIGLTVLENIRIKVVLFMKAFGRMTSNMEKALRFGGTTKSLKDNLREERRMDKAPITGKTDPFTKANGKTIKSKEKEYTPGKMAGNMKENGKKTTCMVMEFTRGKTAESTKANIRMIKSMAKAHISGLMVVSIKENGMMVNSIIVVDIPIKMASHMKESGKMEKELNGLMKIKIKLLKSD